MHFLARVVWCTAYTVRLMATDTTNYPVRNRPKRIRNGCGTDSRLSGTHKSDESTRGIHGQILYGT